MEVGDRIEAHLDNILKTSAQIRKENRRLSLRIEDISASPNFKRSSPSSPPGIHFSLQLQNPNINFPNRLEIRALLPPEIKFPSELLNSAPEPEWWIE